MESEASTIALMESDLRKYRIGSYAMVAGFGFGLVIRLSFAIPQLLSRSPMTIVDIAYTLASSLFLFSALYTLTPRYQRAIRRQWTQSYGKSRDEQFRKVLIGALGGLALSVILVFAILFVEMTQSPGQSLDAYLVDLGPLAVLSLAIVFLAIVVWTSLIAP